MDIPSQKVSVNFNCPECDHDELVAIIDLVDIGNPLCSECDTEMEMGMVHISDANSC